MISTWTLLAFLGAGPISETAPVHSQEASAADATVKKDIIYKKETVIDLSGSVVEGEHQLPPAFFLEKMNTPRAQGFLAERLKFSLRNYNDLGF